MEASLKRQVEEFGKSKGEILANKLELEGLSGATIENILAMEQQLTEMKKAQSEYKNLESASKKVIESLRTPEQVYDDEVANLQKMVDAKLLTMEQMEKAVKNLRTDTEEDIEVNILTKGIVESLSTALGTIKIGGMENKAEQLASTSLKVEQNMEKLLGSMEQNLKNGITIETDEMEKTTDAVEELGGINNSGFETVADAIKELGKGGAIAVLT